MYRQVNFTVSTLTKIFRPQNQLYVNFNRSAIHFQDSPLPTGLPTASPSVTDVPLNTESTSIRIERGPLPIITSRELEYCPPYRTRRQAWVENLDMIQEEKLGLVDLHPDIFAHFPRIDILHENIRWQTTYQKIDWRTVRTRAEMPGGGRKPWPQKGTGRARHGSIRSPIFYNGGKAHGPRGPKTHFTMVAFFSRVKGLCIALSGKFAQDDLKIVDSLDIPSDDPKFLEDLAAERHWGVSVLFVDDTDIMPKNITLATEGLGHFNLMPVYGLNCYSMLKHETLVLTTAAVNRIEERLLFQLHRNDAHSMIQKSARGVQFSAFKG